MTALTFGLGWLAVSLVVACVAGVWLRRIEEREDQARRFADLVVACRRPRGFVIPPALYLAVLASLVVLLTMGRALPALVGARARPVPLPPGSATSQAAGAEVLGFPPPQGTASAAEAASPSAREDAMPRAGESPALYPTKELRADGQRVAGADELRTCAKDPGGREQHAVQHGAGSSDGIETGRRTGDEQHPTRAGNSVGRRGSEEGGPPTPSAAANLLSDLAALQARADRLLARRLLAEDGARALAWACVAGVASVTVTTGEVRGRCRPAPNVGVYRLSSIDAKGARLQASVRPSQHGHDEPGAVGADTDRAGPSLDGGPRS